MIRIVRVNSSQGSKLPVADGIWLPKHFAMKSRSRVVLLFTHRTQEEEWYWGYRKRSQARFAELGVCRRGAIRAGSLRLERCLLLPQAASELANNVPKQVSPALIMIHRQRAVSESLIRERSGA
jgi:hypothetical protein